MMIRRLATLAAASSWLAACASAEPEPTIELEYEKYELDNGLSVVLHVDRSDPIAAVVMTFHVGSSREVPGRTGFAHLFEHLFFLDSENLGPGGLDRLMTRIGSSTNGSTNRDRTNYFEVVPIDGLEKALWAESDKLGFFINTVTESVVAKEKQVVKNEKRQSYDNAPYGHTGYVVARALYPERHPYRWQVIGSLADLDAATLADVQEFHHRWYGPANATLVVAGDLDVERTKAWIERYFGEIRGAEPQPHEPPPPVVLSDTVRLFHEDNFARLPRLTLTWPGVPRYHADSYALRALAELLTEGRSSPFYEVIVEEEGLAPAVSASSTTDELGGEWTIRITAHDGVDLDSVYAAVARAFARFEEQGVLADELERVKARYETGFYRGLSSVLGKAFELADHNVFSGDPGRSLEELRRFLAVTADDVARVYETYLRGRPHVATSFVPRGSAALALEGSERAEVYEEPIVPGAEEELGAVERGAARTPSVIDRSVEPPFGEAPERRAPEVWREDLDGAFPVLGIEDREVPLVYFELRIRGGQLLEDPERVGRMNLLAEIMTAGTARRTPEELEKAIDLLGASIDVRAGSDDFVVSGSTLARNYGATMALVEEILLEPRLDSAELELAKQRVLASLSQRAASPTSVADDVFRRLLYGDHVLAQAPLGDAETVRATTVEDLRGLHATALSPELAAFHVVGAVTRGEAVASLRGIVERWRTPAPALPDAPASDPSRAGLYFVDVPNAVQSVLRIGYLAMPEPDPQFYPATVMNFRLGGGGFASDLTQVLREQRGYTYVASSAFRGSELPGPFQVATAVRANVTYEALALVRSMLESYGPSFDEEDLEATQGFLLRANAGAFETAGAKLGILRAMSAYGFPADYVIRREQVVRDMTVERIRELSARWLDPRGMVWLVVGDARTQLDRLRALGLGQPVLLDREGTVVR